MSFQMIFPNNFTITENNTDDKFYNFLLENITSEGASKFKTSKVSSLFLKVTSSKEEIIGGVAAYIFYGSIQIDILWVKKEYRQKGIGKALIQHLESIAKNKKLKMISVATMDGWNNINFYKKQGFSVEFIKKGFEKGLIQYYLVKEVEYNN